jgi:protein-tyrosine phosphatase
MMPQSQAIARRLGVPNTEVHAARQLTERDVLEADLVLAMSREHRRSSVELTPKALRKAFTVREFARLAGALPQGALEVQTPMLTDDVADRLRAAVEAVASMRGALPPLDDPRDDDVTDPYRQSDAVYEQSAEQLTPAIREVSALLHRAAFGAA